LVRIEEAPVAYNNAIEIIMGVYDSQDLIRMSIGIDSERSGGLNR
jgi:hypothetical protein